MRIICFLSLAFALLFCITGNAVADMTKEEIRKANAELRQMAREDNKISRMIEFGSFASSPQMPSAPITWIILDKKKDGSMLLLSLYGLATQQYHYRFKSLNWKDSYIRSWLNGTFYDTAFSPAEKKRVMETVRKNNNNPKYSTEGGEDTADKVFLLSIDEYKKYKHKIPEKTFNTPYDALLKYPGLAASGIIKKDLVTWWLRSPGKNLNYVSYVGGIDNILSLVGMKVTNFMYVRPAIILKPPVSKGGRSKKGGKRSYLAPGKVSLVPATNSLNDSLNLHVSSQPDKNNDVPASVSHDPGTASGNTAEETE